MRLQGAAGVEEGMETSSPFPRALPCVSLPFGCPELDIILYYSL